MRHNARILRLAPILLVAILLRQVPRLGVRAAPSDLPPRPTVEPTATAAPMGTPASEQDEPTAGATIELRASTAPAAGWSVVQWQDAQGEWHDVEDWQGRLDAGVKRWWVAPADFRKGPFRWVLYETRDGEQVAISHSFDLPRSPYEIVVVAVH